LKRFERPEEGAAVSVKIEKVVKRFGSFQALAGVDVSIRSGEFFTLLGPSGCGKTTLLRCIAGFERPSEGRVLFNDQDMTGVPPWEKNIGFVFQNYALWPNKSVRDNIAYGLEIRKKDKAFIDDKVKWALDLLGLPLIGDQMPEQLSGGQQQRVAIARALVIDPAILLLDEPLSNLDAKLRISLRFQIREIQRKLKITTVYVTHDQEEALEISDRIAVMDKGCVLQIGTPEDIYARPEKRFVAEFVGAANIVEGRREGDLFVCSPGLKIAAPKEEGSRLMFRPEALEEVPEGRRADVEGRIVDVLYRGNIRRCIVDAGCPEPVVYETKAAHAVGETLRLAITHYRLYE
jgi:iron(III) transport system ATP-binding protein